MGKSSQDITRRRFMALAGTAVAFLALPFRGLAVKSAPDTRIVMSGCRITVVRRECFAELQSRYLDDPDTGPCTAFRTGQTFCIGPDGCCPKGFCPRAWKALKAHFSNDGKACTPAASGKSVIVSCSDGTRPVLFRIDMP